MEAKTVKSISELQIGRSIILPPVQTFLRLGKSGLIIHQLVDQTHATITAVRSIDRGGIHSHNLVTLDTGETFAWKETGRLAIGKELLGVIQPGPNGQIKWNQHKETELQFSDNSIGEYQAARKKALESWKGAFSFSSDEALRSKSFGHGLHSHQLGATHAIGAHWSLSNDHATVVMPTGTGKSDTMIAAMTAFVRGTLLVVVPGVPLRNQTIQKFYGLGLLRQLGHLSSRASNPVIGVLTGRIKSIEDLSIFDSCNVVISTMSMVAQGTSEGFGAQISEKCSHLMLDEAHHVPAATWAKFREEFSARPVLLFTATPFRRDKKLIEGTPIYKYPLASAQKDGFFKEITFKAVAEPDESKADKAIAEVTVEVLKKDIKAGFDHIALARTSRKIRADEILKLYAQLAPEFNPIVVYSEKSGMQEQIQLLRGGKSRIVVCVDMLGEGFDLPQLKIAAIHDSYKSLAVLLQFIGRFTRTLGAKLGTATVVANSSRREMSAAFEELYSEDADWNAVLRNYASQAVQDYAESIELLEESEPVELTTEKLRDVQVSPSSLKPKFSTVVYKCDSFRPLLFAKGLPSYRVPHKAWHNRKRNLFFFVTAENPHIDWSRSRSLLELHWHFYVMYYQENNKLLFIHSSDNSTLHTELATVVGGDNATIFNGEPMFRVFAGIKRLLLHSVGLKRRITGRNLRFSQHMGADVAEALSSAQTSSSTKSNIYATGYANGDRIDIGCSHKGRIWTREQGTMSGFLSWCDQIGKKLLDTTFDTTRLISDALIYEEITEFPDSGVLAILWPDELWQKTEHNVKFRYSGHESALYDCSLEVVSASKRELVFSIIHGQVSNYSMRLLPDRKVAVSHLSGPKLVLSLGRNDHDLSEWFSYNPPELHFVDGSEVDGALWIHPQKRKPPTIPSSSFETFNWAGVNLTQESMWHKGQLRTNSIQHKIASSNVPNFDLVFDDDGSGECADLVCIKNETSQVSVYLFHCKYSGGIDAGARVKDVVEVSSQAVRSHKWKHRFEALCNHIQNRERSANSTERKTRFFSGDLQTLRIIAAAAKQKQVDFHITIVQPGLSAGHVTIEQQAVLAAAHAFLLDTIDVSMKVLCSQ